eukprot:3046994-Pleurochrysis_carterae.AAC.4
MGTQMQRCDLVCQYTLERHYASGHQFSFSFTVGLAFTLRMLSVWRPSTSHDQAPPAALSPAFVHSTKPLCLAAAWPSNGPSSTASTVSSLT